MKTLTLSGYVLKDQCVSCQKAIPLEWWHFNTRGNFCGTCCKAAEERIKTKRKLGDIKKKMGLGEYLANLRGE